MTIYFLGGGNMASAMIAGLRAQSPDDDIVVADKNADKHAFLQQTFAVHTTYTLPEHYQHDDVLILAVKPQDMQAALSTIHVGSALVLSIAAGISVANLAKWLGTKRIIRIMPNTPAAVGLAVSGLFAAEGASAADKALAERLMRACGEIVWLHDEAQMHAITAISGSGSAYVFYFMNALQAAAMDLGFDASLAHHLALHTFKGAVALVEQSGEELTALQQKVSSKGGTTFAALNTFDQYKVAASIQAGVQAAATRSQEMAASTD